MDYLMIARGKPGDKPEQVQALGQAEAKKVWHYYTTGKAKLMYYFANHKGAVMLLEADDYEAATAMANSFPMAEAGLIEVEVIGLVPYTGLERLFIQE